MNAQGKNINAKLPQISILFTLMAMIAGLIIVSVLNLELPRPILTVIYTVLLLALAVQSLLVLNFFKSLGMVNGNAEKLANGELNISDVVVEKAKGVETLASAYNDMKSNLLSFIEMTKGNVIVLSDAIQKVSNSIQMSYKGNEQIAININRIAEKAQDQNALMRETIESIESISKRVETITANIANIEKGVEDTVVSTNSGTTNLDQLFSQFDTISNNLNKTYSFIDKLSLDIKEITEVGEFIIRISEQLKLLGINASVEASKAGEFSKGFTVVAHEINQLSAKTKEGIGRIKAIVENTIKSSEVASESITGCVESFNNSMQTFNSVKHSFYSINNQSISLERDMKNILADINLINLSSKETNAKSVALLESSTDISSKTQEVAAVTEEELAEFEEIHHNTQSLNNMLSSIRKLTGRFNTSVTPCEPKNPKKLKLAYISAIDNPFWLAVRQGALYAQKELEAYGTHVEYIGMDVFNPEEFMKNLKEYIGKGYDGFAIPGYFPDSMAIVDQMWGKGVPFVVYNSDMPGKTKRLAYYGPNNFNQGLMAGNIMVKTLEGKGNILIAGRKNEPEGNVHGDRIRGFRHSLSKNKKMRIVDHVAVNDTIQENYAAIKEYLGRNKDVDGIFIAGGGPTGAARAVEEAGLKGKTRIVCYDHDQQIFEYVNKDIILAAIGQDPFGQGHDPLIYLYNYLAAGQQPEKEFIETRMDIVDKRNVNNLLAL